MKNPVAMRQAFHANEDGTTKHTDVAIHLQSDLNFRIVLPDYIANAAELMATSGGRTYVQAPTVDGVDGVIARYEAAAEAYSAWRLSLNATPMLWLGVRSNASDFESTLFGINAQVGLGLQEVYLVDRGGKDLRMLLRDGERFGTLVGDSQLHNVVVPDTPEVRAQMQRLIASLQTAAKIVEGLRETDDPVAYLMGIDLGDKPAEPVQGTLPLDEPATEPAQQPATEPVVDEDPDSL